MQLIVPPGQGHNMWPGFFQSQELVDFVTSHAAGITISSPLDYQVIQRPSKQTGSITLRGEFADAAVKKFTIEARLIVDGKPGNWRRLTLHSQREGFEGRLDAPAGGWHRLEVRARSGGSVLAESAVEHVGIGEIFVIAQSRASGQWRPGRSLQRPRPARTRRALGGKGRALAGQAIEIIRRAAGDWLQGVRCQRLDSVEVRPRPQIQGFARDGGRGHASF